MEFRVEAAIPRAASEVWAVLVDIPKIAGCIPGCEDVQERVRLADYSAVLRQKLGPFKVALPAMITVQEVREPNWVKALASGTEKFTGTRIDVTLRMDLRDTEPGSSHMVAECDMQVAGKLASLGYSIIKKKAEENFAEFRTRLLKVLEECPVLRVQESLMGECVAPLVGLPSEPIVDGGRGLESVVEVAADVSVETHLELSISETLEAVEQAPTTAQLDDAPGPQLPPLPTTQA